MKKLLTILFVLLCLAVAALAALIYISDGELDLLDTASRFLSSFQEQESSAPSAVEPSRAESSRPRPPEESEAPAQDIPIPGAVFGELDRKHFYNTLDTETRKLYAVIYQALLERAPSVDLGKAAEELVTGTFYLLMADSPELFWVEHAISYQITTLAGIQTNLNLQFSYNMTGEAEIARAQQLVNQYAADCLSGIPAGASQFEQVLHVYEYIIVNTEYILNSENDQNMMSVVQGRRSVCTGYAKTTQYLLGLLGIPGAMIDGVATGQESHAWNLVCVDGSYYYLDTTWGDPVSADPVQQKSGWDNLSYDYFLLTAEEIGRTHTADSRYDLPPCTSKTHNYYTWTGRLLEAHDLERLREIAAEDFADGKLQCTVRFTSASAFQEAYSALIDGGELFEILYSLGGTPGAGTEATFSTNEDLLIFTFDFPESIRAGGEP